jgi:hypothetical protein
VTVAPPGFLGRRKGCAMKLESVQLFGAGDDPLAQPVDIAIEIGLIAAIEPARSLSPPRRLATPARSDPS